MKKSYLAMIGVLIALAAIILHPTQIRAAATPTYPTLGVTNSVWVTAPTGKQVQVKFASFSIPTASAHTVIVTGVTGKTIMVLGYDYSPTVAAGSLSFETSTSNTVIAGPYTTNAIAPIYVPFSNYGYFTTTTSGDSLQGTVTGSSNTIAGVVRYIIY